MRHSNGKRSRGRSGRRPAPQQNINRAYDSNGPAGKLRGTAAQLVEKYVSLARDARVGRDRVLVENFLQHAEHYQRIMNEIMIAQGLEPEAVDDDDQGSYDDQPDERANGNVRQSNGNGNGNGQGSYNGGGNGGGNGNDHARPQAQPQPVAAPAPVTPPQPQPVILGVEDQPDISADVPVIVPPTPTATPRAPRARRPRRVAPRAEAAADEAAPAPAAAAEGSDAD
ncbi:DUF4167 domain-containing protein [Iodidimonas sp. SYSU 1G8]|uniref:DUF4167 domain-containing protein n=1 Tax=Iodidimonas sp. SYSU 1G8 TaxID=3133967 RepID=UPI0031FE6884